MSMLGIYFGIKGISIVESKGKKILNNISIPLSIGESEEKVPEEVKIVALFKDELRKNKIEAKEASVALPGKDLFIRTFGMPLLPRAELASGVQFEAKKYIPFKMEELVSSFETRFDKANRKNSVLFVGIRKETLDKYLSILSQLEIKTNLLEYSAFSVLRLLKLGGIRDKGVLGVISADFQEEDEANFVVLQDGFPLFSRDITLSASGSEPLKPRAIELSQSLEKFKTELRVSLDYYDRKFPNKNIEKIFLISGEGYPELITFVKDLGLSLQFIDTRRYIGKEGPLSLSIIKGYSCSLAKVIRTDLKVNLAAVKAKLKATAEKIIPVELPPILTGLRIDPRIAVLGILLFIATFIFGLYLRLPVQRNFKNILALRPQVTSVSPDFSYEELANKDSEYKTKVAGWRNLIENRLYLTEPLDVLPRLIPEGVWLVNLSLKEQPDKRELKLEGMAYAEDSAQEFELVNNFLLALKNEVKFNKYFKEINIESLNTQKTENKTVVKFIISAFSHLKE